LQRFLEACASYIFQKYGGNLSELCLVFPNRRSGIFFTAYLKKCLDKPVIGPKITTINELMLSLSDLVPADRLKLISSLYETYRELTGTTETFDDFYFWGEVLLTDFDDVDKYLVNAADLFKNLSSLKDIENQFDYLNSEQKKLIEQFWGSLRSWENYSHEKDFVSLWGKLYAVYAQFGEKLKNEGLGYPGMIIRNGIENLKDDHHCFQFRKFFFIGHNALNSCEKRLLTLLKELGKAEFFWDYDDYYLKNRINNAGKFIRDNLLNFPPPVDFNLDVNRFSTKKEIEIVAVASKTGQAQVVPGSLPASEPATELKFDRTAIILADESLLFPVLGAIPADAGMINITMGYPLKNSPLVSLLLLIATLIRNTKAKDSDKPFLYFKPVTDILCHQLLKDIEPEKVADRLKEIKNTNKIYLNRQELEFSDLHRRIFNLPPEMADYPAYFLEILRLLFEKTGEQPEGLLLKETIYATCLAFEKLQSMISGLHLTGKTDISKVVFFRLMMQYINQITVPFEGEPLSGIQVMGILETRCLDFDNLIIIGLNEEIWPRSSVQPSMIPFNLRKGFGLPGIDDQDAMYAYYFYRLIQRAKHITATWSTIRELFSGGELSRFGFQLMLHSPHQIVRRNSDFSFYSAPPETIVARSSPVIAGQLLETNRSEKPLSPSALNMFQMCSLKFWFRYVAGLKEPDEVTEEIDRQLFGNIFHKAAENLYHPLVGRMASKNDFEAILDKKETIQKAILRAFATEYFFRPVEEWKNLTLEGKPVLIAFTIEKYLQNLLENDLESAPLFIHSLEKEVEFSMQIEIEGVKQSIRIGGKVDRVDETDGVVRVVDYKTGSLSSSELQCKSLDELFDRTNKQMKKEIIQALIYALILKKGDFPGSSVQPVVFGILSLKDESMNPKLRINGKAAEISEAADELERHLKAVTTSIYAPDAVFSQTEFSERCRYCPYNVICRR
jgi:RecB family exonuclease